MAFVDLLLRLLSQNPASYYETQDKWSAIVAYFIVRDNYFMPWILGGIPILWLVVRKWRKKQITKLMVVAAITLAIILGYTGFFILDFLSELAFGLSYQRMYGDLFN